MLKEHFNSAHTRPHTRRYRRLTERLCDARLRPDQTDDGRTTRQRWPTAGLDPVTVDILIPP
jgi:hypothetical protein